jgi:N-methylhydantoinase A
VRSWRGQLDALDWPRANALLAEMELEGAALLERSGVAHGHITHRREADMRYVGQGHEIRVPLPAGALHTEHATALADAFRAVYRELYERLGPPVAIEVINWRVESSGPKPHFRLRMATAGTTNAVDALKGERPAYFPEANGFTPTPIYDRYRLAPGAAFTGPAIVEERESTVIVGPGAACEIDQYWNLNVSAEC